MSQNLTPSTFLGGPDCGKTPDLESDLIAIPVPSGRGYYLRTDDKDGKGRIVWQWSNKRERRPS
jgi:hypothetical protein